MDSCNGFLPGVPGRTRPADTIGPVVLLTRPQCLTISPEQRRCAAGGGGRFGGLGALVGRRDERGRNRYPPCSPSRGNRVENYCHGRVSLTHARSPDVTTWIRSTRPIGGGRQPSAGHGHAVPPSRPRTVSPWAALRPGRRPRVGGQSNRCGRTATGIPPAGTSSSVSAGQMGKRARRCGGSGHRKGMSQDIGKACLET